MFKEVAGGAVHILLLTGVAVGAPAYWAPKGSPDAVIAGFENGVSTNVCRAFVTRANGSTWKANGRTWPGDPNCHIAFDGQRHDRADFEVLAGDGIVWTHSHHAGVPQGVVISAINEGYKKTVPCVALRASGELVPGWITVDGTLGCSYTWVNNTSVAETSYLLPLAPADSALPRTEHDQPAQCSGGLCEFLDTLGRDIAKNPVPFIIVVAGIATCAIIGGSVGAGVGAAGAGLVCRRLF